MEEGDNVIFSSIFVTPNHPIYAHAYILQSTIRSHADVQCGGDSSNDHSTELIPDDTENSLNKGDFFILDSSGNGYAAFYATPTVPQRDNNVRRACLVRDPGGKDGESTAVLL